MAAISLLSKIRFGAPCLTKLAWPGQAVSGEDAAKQGKNRLEHPRPHEFEYENVHTLLCGNSVPKHFESQGLISTPAVSG